MTKSRGLGHIDREVGARLRQFRVRKQLSQTELANELGVTFQQVQKYEKGANAMATARLPSLCTALGITPNDLYGDLFTGKRGRPSSAPQLDSATVRAALLIEKIPRAVRTRLFQLIAVLAGEDSEEA